jgi:FtsZ-interacting cell division protein ZipA
MARIEELIEQIKEYMGLVEEVPVKKKSNALAVILTIVGAIAVIAAICYAVYRFLGPSYYEDFEDDYEDDFDDDFFDDEEEETIEVPVKKEEKKTEKKAKKEEEKEADKEKE